MPVDKQHIVFQHESTVAHVGVSMLVSVDKELKSNRTGSGSGQGGKTTLLLKSISPSRKAVSERNGLQLIREMRQYG